jgi:hypothetical protein
MPLDPETMMNSPIIPQRTAPTFPLIIVFILLLPPVLVDQVIVIRLGVEDSVRPQNITTFSLMGYSAKCCDVKIMQWNQIYRKWCDLSHPEQGAITLETTPSFWRGFRMMVPALTTLIGFAGQTVLFARIVEASRRGA